MTSLDQKRKTDNEAVFRKYNETMTEGLEHLRETARREGWSDTLSKRDDPLHFYCECSREECEIRVLVKPSVYDEIHKDRRRFVIMCGHETPSVESVLTHGDAYCIVEKYSMPDEDSDTLQPTITEHPND